ncbi:translocation/assembly module TamB domain-containing protein [Salinibacter grassmerensis]|uniref:translocation/assembly module TamB domain-containing protein n=1 Tax=Salinibacter grassmerensis TaxID=3040353 RepID=UPI0021E96F5E|nr:translocation/assembly module TamB domain-containing protein [Salinibacter grassmerensis]
MPDSSTRRSFTQPLWRAFRVAFAAVMVGVVFFVGLTRTEVGRDQIRQQIEAQFDQQFLGTLSIDSLSGSLLTSIEASGVQLRDSSGTLVGTVEGIQATPQWANLLTAELSVQSLTLIRPHLVLHRDSAGAWNAADAFRQVSPSSSGNALDLTFADIEVQRGRVTTTRSGSAPDLVRRGWLFDYTQTTVKGLSFSAVAQRTGTRRFVELSNGSFSMPDEDLRVSFVEGQLQRTSNSWSITGLDLSLDTTRIRGRASIQTSAPDGASPQVSVRLDRSRIDQGEIRRIVPRLPLADVVTLEGTLGGTARRLSADDVTITHNASTATLNGTLQRASEGLTMDLRLTDSRLAPEDLRDVWPAAPPLPPTDNGPFNLTASLQGTTANAQSGPRTFDLATRLAVESPHGAVRGSLGVARSASSGLTYNGTLKADSLNLAPLTGRPALASQLSGQVEGSGSGTQLGTLRGSVDVSLSDSRIGGRSFTAADGMLTINGDSTNGTLNVRQDNGGRLYVNGAAQGIDRRPTYTATVTGSDLDLGSIVGPPAPSTQLNGHMTVGGSGAQWRSLTGTAVLQVDSSRVNHGDSTVMLPPHSVALRLADQTADRPRIELSGSVLRLTADGTSLGPPLWAAARTWGAELQDAVRRERNKPSPSRQQSSIQPSLYLPTESSSRASLQSQIPLKAKATMEVLQPKIVHAWWPAFPKRTENLTAETRLSVGPDSFHTAGRVSADLIQSGPNAATDLRAEYDVSSRINAPLAQSTLATASVTAGRAALRGPALKNPTVSLTYGGRTGRLQAQADSLGIADSVYLSGGLRVTPRANELRLQDVSANINGSEWTNASPASLRAYSDALVVTPFRIQQPHPDTPSLQKIRIGGTVSARSSDTLAVEAQNVYLPPLSQALGLPQLIGGNLDGEVRLRSALGQPELVSDVAVQRLSFDRRVLGSAQLRLAYAPQSPDLRVRGRLRSEAQDMEQLTGPELVPSGARTVEPNDISVSGRVRLPEWARAASSNRTSALPPGETLDLSVDVDRADLFFFRYIFEERVAGVRGFVTGPLHIGGRVLDPRFEADFDIVNGAVRLPVFGLAYEVEGPVEVDKRGIHARTLRVQDEEGTATVDGSILFNDYQYFSFDLSASLDGITVIDVSQAEDLPFYGQIRASGPLRLTGPLPDATLESNSARTTPDSELYIPVSGRTVEEDAGFIVFADSTGQAPSVSQLTRRPNILADRPEGVPSFVEGLNLNLNVTAPDQSTVNLVFDPLVGDVVTVVGSGRVQLQREEGDFSVYGSFDATSGTYLFTAGEVFVRRFAINQGTITWDGSPTNAQLDLDAEYRTRASPSGLPGFDGYSGRIPVTVQLAISGRVASPQVDLGLSITRSEERNLIGSETLDAVLNQPARTTEYATSVLLTNTFLLTTESITQTGTPGSDGESNQLTTAGNQLAFNSVSQLVSSQLNRYLGEALPNVDLNFGVQGEDPSNLDLIYGVALRLLNERLIIRGEGVYTNDDPADPEAQRAEGPQGEFVVEVRLSPSVSAKVFYRRTGDELTPSRALTSSRGAGVSYQTQFSTWRTLLHSIFGWMLPTDSPSDDEERPTPDPVAGPPVPPPDSTASTRAQGPPAQNEPV